MRKAMETRPTPPSQRDGAGRPYRPAAGQPNPGTATERSSAGAGSPRETEKVCLMDIPVLALVIVATLTIPSAADAAPPQSFEARTPAGVVAADRAWGEAELRGDVRAVERLLMADYRSVDAAGNAIDRTQILAAARANAGHPERAARAMAWKRGHPTFPRVQLAGDTAILTWISAADARTVLSCDIFVFRAGRWRAAYSQHSAASAT
jgi:hypothetical protein